MNLAKGQQAMRFYRLKMLLSSFDRGECTESELSGMLEYYATTNGFHGFLSVLS